MKDNTNYIGEIGEIGVNELVFNKDDKQGIYSGGFDVKSIMMKGGVSPIMTLNTQNGGGDTNKVSDLFGITVLLIQFIYREFEFTRVGYYINNELKGPIEKDSNSEFFFKVKNTERNILIKEPRVTQFFFQTK